MWDNHRLLNRVANVLYAVGVVCMLYAVLMMVIRLPIFPLRQVSVSGQISHTTREQVDAIVREQVRGNFFTLDLERTRLAFEKLPWVRQANLRRAWPDRLEVLVEEHVAVARWRDTGLVNSYGEVFAAASNARLPVFAGPDGAAAEMVEHYRGFRELLLTVGREPLELRLSDRRAWALRSSDGYFLELGRQDMSARLARFVAGYEKAVAQLRPGIYRVDLRYPNGFAVRLPGLRWTAAATSQQRRDAPIERASDDRPTQA
jgi:cell division protein FtsQ